MKIYKLVNNNNRKLILFFAGWSASPEWFRTIQPGKDYDLWICYDYRDLEFKEQTGTYQEIDLIAWSLGVWVVSVLLTEKEKLFTPARAIAINGTPSPVHDLEGIPEATFRGTLENVTEEGMSRFNRRMYGSREILRIHEKYPARPLEEIRKELQYLYQEILSRTPVSDFWTQAILSVSDCIFPSENLKRYWSGRCPVKEINAPHYPFYLWKQWNEIWE